MIDAALARWKDYMVTHDASALWDMLLPDAV
ncbi:MAG: nuclear transport factor 2 family protein, partial [Phycisphaerae bacterium]|nr:nuclear transport factor 2 family protein [Phycisphaerae bacterium]